jgi:hypothetical protein
MTDRVYEKIYELHGDRWDRLKYADQVALGLLSRQYEVGSMTNHHSRVLTESGALLEPGTNVLRYQEFDRLNRIYDVEVCDQFEDLKLSEPMARTPPVRRRLKDAIKRVLPWR